MSSHSEGHHDEVSLGAAQLLAVLASFAKTAANTLRIGGGASEFNSR